MADKHIIPKGKMHYRLLPEDIVCKSTQRNNIRRVKTCDPAPKLLNEEITSDIQKHKQNIWKEHLDDHWDLIHITHILWTTIHGLSNRAPPTTFNIKHTQTYCELCQETYKDASLRSPLLRSKRQYNKTKITTHKVMIN